jgi:tRNA (mo5U34)-methyltransferase
MKAPKKAIEMTKKSKKQQLKEEPVKTIGQRILDVPYWYHKIELPGDIITPGWSPMDATKYGVPDDLTGKRILDIGAWDGYWTWESLKRGASEVVAIDDFSDDLGNNKEVKRNGWNTFDLCREALGFSIDVSTHNNSNARINDKGQIVSRHEMSVYDIEKLGHFDIVFFFGMIYHMKHPLLALEKISEICDGEIYIESAVIDDFSPYLSKESETEPGKLIFKGYPENNMVMEFYPDDQYACNKTNWWVPTIQTLGAMVSSVGFKNVHGWALTDMPQELAHCRGFVYGSKKEAVNDAVMKLETEGLRSSKNKLKVAAVMSVPRLGFQDNSFCVIEGLMPLKIPIIKSSGAFWGQCLERGMRQQIDEGFDAVLTIDYDTIFKQEDVEILIKLMLEHPEADAIVPIQAGRANMGALMTLKTKTGQVREVIRFNEFQSDITKIATGHFGLTLIRSSSLLKLPTPWFWAQPNSDSYWGPGKIDDDIYFWKLMEKAGMIVYSANRVILGHLELTIKWLDTRMNNIFQTTKDYQDIGKPENVWK